MAFALGVEQDCIECRMCGNGKGGKKMTNFERIKRMNVEELADFISENSKCDYCSVQCDDKPNIPTMSSCYCRWLEWLESECDSAC